MPINKMNETCERFVEAMWLFLSEELAEADRAFWQAHLQNCSTCQMALTEARQTLSAYRRLGDADIDDSAFERAVHAAVNPPSQPRRLFTPKIVLGWAAPLAVDAALLLFFLLPKSATAVLNWQATMVDNRLALLEEDIYRVEMLELAGMPLSSFEMDATLWESEVQRVAYQIEMLRIELAVGLQADEK